MGSAYLIAISEGPISFFAFAREVGPNLGLFTGISVILGLTVQFLVDAHLYRRNLQKWLDQHQESIQKVMMLSYLTESVRQKLPPCPHCQQAHYQFWSFGRGQITYQCKQCSQISPIRGFSNGEVRLILEYLPALLVVLPGLKRFQKDFFSRRLNRVCEPIALYCNRYYSRLEDKQRRS